MRLSVSAVAIVFALISAAPLKSSGSPSQPSSPLEAAFAREKAKLTCLSAPTDEPSCGGTNLDVYLHGDQIVCLRWEVDMSNKYVRREFFLQGGEARWMVETIWNKFDQDGTPLRAHKFRSEERIKLDPASEDKGQMALRDHARELIGFFREHRGEFMRP